MRLVVHEAFGRAVGHQGEHFALLGSVVIYAQFACCHVVGDIVAGGVFDGYSFPGRAARTRLDVH